MIISEQQLRQILKAECKEAGSQRAWAAKHKLEATVVSRIINGDRPFTKRMLKALKAKPINRYQVPEMSYEDIE